MNAVIRSAVLIILVLMLVGSIYPQHCPISIRTIFFLVENGTTAHDLRYEIFPVLPLVLNDDPGAKRAWIQSTFRVTPENASDLMNGHSGRHVLPLTAHEILKNYDSTKFKPPTAVVPTPMKGAVRGGKLVFKATEYSSNLFLMKVTSSNFEPVYYVADFFGGCNDVNRITVMDHRRWPID